MNKYYYLKGDRQHGPVTVDELKTQGATRETMVWIEGMADWVAAKDVAEIAAVLPPPAPRVVTPPPPSKTEYNVPLSKESKKSPIGLIIGVAVVGFIIFFLWLIGAFRTDTPLPISNNVIPDSTEVAKVEPEPIPVPVVPAPKVEGGVLDFETEEFVKNWRPYFTTKVVQAHVKDFGGIDDVMVSVTNASKFHMHEIALRVNYIQKNGKVFKKEIVEMYDLKVGETRTISAPSSERGERLSVSVADIFTKPIGRLY